MLIRALSAVQLCEYHLLISIYSEGGARKRVANNPSIYHTSGQDETDFGSEFLCLHANRVH